MKRNIAIILSIVLVFTLIIPSTIIAKKDYTNFINKKAPKERDYKDGNGKKHKLSYINSETLFFDEYGDPKKRIDVYGTYDVYRDKSKTEYRYLYNTNKLCFINLKYNIKYNGEQYETDKIPESEAKKLASKYLKKELKKRFNDYTFRSVYYGNQEAIYCVTYSRVIGGYFSDDDISVFMDYKGNIYCFSALLLERYKTFRKTDIHKESLERALNASKVERITLSMDQNIGKLISVIPKSDGGQLGVNYYIPSAPKLSFSSKKITPKTKSIRGKVTKAIKNRTYIICGKYKKGKMIKQIAKKTVNNGMIDFKVKLKKLKKGEKIKIYIYTIYNKGLSDKLFKKNGSSKIISVK